MLLKQHMRRIRSVRSLRRSLVVVIMLPMVASAQRTSLELRPRVGDTLRMRLDQVTEMSATRQGAAPREIVTRSLMLSRAIVESEAPDAVYILAITDSVEVKSSDANAKAIADATRRQLSGRQMRLRLSPDGTVSMADRHAPVSKAVTDLVSVMPASFPRDPVAVGDTWSREMPMASGLRLPGVGTTSAGVARATFRLDSLSRAGELAYISMRGTLGQPAGAPQAGGAVVTPPTLGGTLLGTMIVDRRRGWLSESRFVVDVHTTIAGTALAATDFHMRITQHMRVFERPARR